MTTGLPAAVNLSQRHRREVHAPTTRVALYGVVFAAFPAWSPVRSPERGAAARAQLRELLNDELGLAAALVATLLVIAGWAIADPIASIIVAVHGILAEVADPDAAGIRLAVRPACP